MLEPECPRCAYDLNGEVSRWIESCPLEGTCPECGLTFQWRSIVSEKHRRPPDFFETATNRFARALLMTVWNARNPFRFWRWVRMEYPIAWGRIARVVLLTVVALHGIFVSIAFVARVLLLPMNNGWLRLNAGAPDVTVFFVAWPFHSPARNFWGSPRFHFDFDHAWLAVATVSMIVMPFAFALAPTTLGKARVRPRHLFRIAAYSFIWLPVVWACFTFTTLALENLYAHLYLNTSLPTLGRFIAATLEAVHSWTARRGHISLATLALLWPLIWWGCACTRYLRLPRGWLMAVMLQIVSILVVMTLSAAVFGAGSLLLLLPR